MANPYTAKQVALKVTNAKNEIKKGNIKEKKLSLDNGLLLVVRNTSIKYQARILISKTPKKFKQVLIGNYDDIKLDQAYEQVTLIKKQLENEQLEQIAEKAKSPLFGEYWREYREITDNANHLSNARRLSLNSLFNSILKVFADYRLNEITPTLVNELVKDLPVTQNNRHNALCALNACFDFAESNEIIEVNRLRKLMSQPQNKKDSSLIKHHKFVPADRLKCVLFEPLEQYPISYKVFVLLICLTACRNSEIRCLKWDNVNFKATDKLPYGLITIKNEDTKTRKDKSHDDYYIPLTKQLANLLKRYHKIMQDLDTPLLFPSRNDNNKPISMSMLLLPPNISCEMELHGLRATASTFLNEHRVIENFNDDEIERVLHHKTDSNKVRKAYNRYDFLKEHYQLLTFYNDYIEREQLTQSFLELVK